MGVCCIKGCESPSHAGDMCGVHYNRMKRHGSPLRTRRVYGATNEERFWAKVRKTDTCWLWTGAKSHGYGSFGLRRADGFGYVSAHRFSYELASGNVPTGLVLDHLCRTPACVRPDHLEPVTQLENTRRGVVFQPDRTHCKREHEFSPENTYIDRRGRRICIQCRRQSEARYRERKRAARSTSA